MKKRVVEALIEELGDETVLGALRMMLPRKVRRVERRLQMTMSALSTGLLLSILSRCWRNTLQLMLVCREWRDAIVDNPDAYWKHAMAEKLRLPDWLFPEARRFFQTKWSPFDVTVPPSRERQIGWVFTRHSQVIWRREIKADQREYHWLQFYQNYVQAEWHISIEGQNISRECNFKDGYRDFKRVHGSETPDYQSCTEIIGFNLKLAYSKDITWISRPNDLQWKGEGIRKTLTLLPIPHGSGTWTVLSTGATILQGENVAFAGRIHDGKTWFAGRKL